MIRRVEAKEIRRVVVFMKNFEEASRFVEVDIEYATRRYEGIVSTGQGVVFVLEDERKGTLMGAFGAIKGQDLHNGRLMAVETFWFMHPTCRGKGGLSLFNAFERWAEEQGCVPAMVHMTDSYPEKLKRLYERRGYRLVESHYVKELEQ